MTGRLTGLPLLAVAYAAARASVVLGIAPVRFPDSTGYLALDFLSPEARLWPVPLVYSLVRSDAARVGIHVLAGVVAWVLLAHVLSARSRFPGTARAVVLAVGLAPQVVRYDLTILSESLAISAAVATVALGVRAARRRSADPLFIAVFTVFCMTRPQHLLLLFAAAAVVLVRTAVRRALPGLTATVILVAAALGGVMLHGNRPTSELNFYTVVVERVLNDDSRFAWFVAHGMPEIPGMRQAQSYDYPEQLPADVARYLRVPTGQAPPSLMRVGGMKFAEWVRADGWRTYAEFVITHPTDTRARLSGLADPTLDPPNDDFLPLLSRTVMARWVFVPWQACAVIALAGIVMAIGAADRARMRILLACTAATFVLYSSNALTSGIEHPRHMSTVAVLVRLAALVALSQMFTARNATTEDQTATV